jgi:hypothetical protein
MDNSPKRGVFFALFDQSLPLKRSQRTRPPVAVLFRNEMSGVLNKNGMTRRNDPASSKFQAAPPDLAARLKSSLPYFPV